MLKVTLIALGDKMPKWVDEATAHYTKRLQEYVQLSLITLPIEKRVKSQAVSVYLEKEAKRITAALPPQAYSIALDSKGKAFNSEQLSQTLAQLQLHTSHLCLLIGGPDGLAPAILEQMQARWSLSMLTFPHPLARIILLEALYRGFSLLNNSPYHR